MILHPQSAYFLNPLYGIFLQELIEQRAFLTPLDLAVDGDRNATKDDPRIKFDGSDKTSPEEPYEFWINNDKDDDGEAGDIRTAGDLEPSGNGDLGDSKINGLRDLEDFSRIALRAPSFLKSLQDINNIKMGFRWSNDSTGNPAIRLYRLADRENGSMDYLFDETKAQEQLDTDGEALVSITKGGDVTYLPIWFWSGYEEGQDIYFLFEGVSEGKGELEFAFKMSDGTEIFSGTGVHLELKDIKDMYERYEPKVNPLWTRGPVDDPYTSLNPKDFDSFSSLTTDEINQLHSSQVLDEHQSLPGTFKYGEIEDPEEKDYILFVHGWRMHHWEKQAFAETGYKRLFWQNYKGRYGAYFWPTEWTFRHEIGPEPPNILDPRNYSRSNWKAYASANALSDLINELNNDNTYKGNVRVMAHSMGNVVTSEALRIGNYSGNSRKHIHSYAAMQSATVAHSYSASSSDVSDLDLGFISWLTDPSTLNVYASYPSSTVDGAPLEGTSLPYFKTVNGAVSNEIINMHNEVDAATTLGWLFLQWEKPDLNYDYNGSPFSSDYQTFEHNGEILNFPEDRYEIFAHGAQAHSRALGACPSNDGVNNFGSNTSITASLNLNDLSSFGGDPNQIFIDNKEDHSAQFMASNMTRFMFWQKLITLFDLDK